MRVFVRQQFARADAFVPRFPIVRTHAVFAALVVFQPDAAQFFRQRQQEVVVHEMARCKQLVSLAHQFAVGFDLHFGGVQFVSAVGHQIQHHGPRRARRIQFDTAEMAAGKHR